MTNSMVRGGHPLHLILLLLAAGCASSAGVAPPGVTVTQPPSAPRPMRTLPPVPALRGELRIDVVYPGENAAVAVRDSTFIFGNVGRGDASLTINGAPVQVAANGAWLAYLPVPGNGVYQLAATADGRTVTGTRTIRVPGTASAAPSSELRIVDGSITPSGSTTRVVGERVEVTFRGTPGGQARLVLGDGRVVQMVEREAVERSSGFMLNRVATSTSVSEYTGSLELTANIASGADLPPSTLRSAPSTGPGAALPTTTAHVELAAGGEMVRRPLPAAITLVHASEPRAAVASTPRVDGTVIGRRAPGADQAWDFFWPNGTLFAIDAEADGFYRVRLTPEVTAWVARDDVTLLPEGTPPPKGFVGPSIQLTPREGWTEVRFSMSEPLPFRVEPAEWGLSIEFYGATGRPAYLGYGVENPFVRRVDWEQRTDDLFRFNVRLARPLWGYRYRWEGSSLVLEVREPPRIDASDPLRGLTIGVDAGHRGSEGDIGAIGPTRLTEAEATLAVTRRISQILRARGVNVVEIRPDEGIVPLIERPMIADRENVHLLVSVHFNAFPDGVDPFASHGTTMFYFWPHSLDFGRHLQREILAEVGLPDRGVRYQNLGMTRTPWMPAVLTETLFLMFPEQEAALRDPAVVDRIAAAHVRAMESFVRERTAQVAAMGSDGW